MLTIKRPTPTTVLYTVSTRPSTATLPSRFLVLCSILLRLGTGLLVLTTLLYDFKHSQIPYNNSNIPFLTTFSDAIPLETTAPPLLGHLLQVSTRPSRLALSALATYLILRRFHTTESLLVIRGLGVQTSTSSPSYVGTARTRFIPTSSIQDIFIHEAFRGFEVRFYLSIVVEGEEGVVVVFPVSFFPSYFGADGWELDTLMLTRLLPNVEHTTSTRDSRGCLERGEGLFIRAEVLKRSSRSRSIRLSTRLRLPLLR